VNLVLAPGAPPRVDVFFDAKSVSIEALDAAIAGGGHFQGGRANLSANLAMTGATPGNSPHLRPATRCSPPPTPRLRPARRRRSIATFS